MSSVAYTPSVLPTVPPAVSAGLSTYSVCVPPISEYEGFEAKIVHDTNVLVNTVLGEK